MPLLRVGLTEAVHRALFTSTVRAQSLVRAIGFPAEGLLRLALVTEPVRRTVFDSLLQPDTSSALLLMETRTLPPARVFPPSIPPTVSPTVGWRGLANPTRIAAVSTRLIIALQVEVRQVHLASFRARANRAALSVRACTDAVVSGQLTHRLLWVPHLVLLQPQPKRVHITHARLRSSGDNGLNTRPCQAVVGHVKFFDRPTLLQEVCQCTSARVVDHIFVDLEDLQLLAPGANVKDPAQTSRSEPIL